MAATEPETPALELSSNSLTGSVFELSHLSFGWHEQILYNFQGDNNDGGYPFTGVILDSLGNLYGASSIGGPGGGGSVFMLSRAGGTWVFDLVYGFNYTGYFYGFEGPRASLTMDSNGNLYGTTDADGAYLEGSVFKLTPSDGSWSYTDLHDFSGGADGSAPISSVVMDASGNLYGTTSNGGAYGYGTVWEITP